MDIALPVSVGALFASSIYMLLGRDLVRIAVGILLLGVAANILIFVAGGMADGIPPLVPPGATALPEGSADPLPQALILTAIVISFGLSAFGVVLFWSARRTLGDIDTQGHRLAEPEDALHASSPGAERVPEEAKA